ncbi:MAG: hypothetical protein Ct9H300mP1_17150 [Planctomycetaceae bacterium]|nr:MAG: hypothetical protein Ct9H300mP1_17150 [Planctomycetaceae bacterium]
MRPRDNGRPVLVSDHQLHRQPRVVPRQPHAGERGCVTPVSDGESPGDPERGQLVECGSGSSLPGAWRSGGLQLGAKKKPTGQTADMSVLPVKAGLRET